MNNLKFTDYINVTIQALAHILPLRDYFLQPSNYQDCTSPLVHKFGELMRKMWSRGNFKSTVSPHELVQTISTASDRRFTVYEQHDVLDFFTWFVNQLHQYVSMIIIASCSAESFTPMHSARLRSDY